MTFDNTYMALQVSKREKKDFGLKFIDLINCIHRIF